MGKFVIKTSDTGCHFVLKADNGEVIATSQHYLSLIHISSRSNSTGGTGRENR